MYDYIIVLFSVLVSIKSTIYITFVRIAQKRGVNFVFYELLKKICDEKGIKITPLVLSCGGSKGMLSGWKQGASPNVDMLVKLSDTLNCSMDYLMGRNTHDAYTTTTGNTNVIQQCKISHSPIHMNEELTDGLEHELLSVMKNFSRRDKIKILNFAYEIDEANKKTN